jgi:hypothetical protein
MKTPSRWLAMTVLALGAASAQAAPRSLVSRDAQYEQFLRYEASADKTLTPAKVIRWLRGNLQMESLLSSPSKTEFQPIVQVHDAKVRVLATIAYKF